MVWSINTVKVPENQSAILYSNSNSGQVIAKPGAVLRGNFVLAFPGLGYVQGIDKANTVPGGDWSVQLTNGSKNWFYSGQGEAHVTVDAQGNYTWSGPNGSNSVTGKLATWQ